MNEAATEMKRHFDRVGPLSELDAEILEGIIAASNDACWCMEFGEPVDLTAPDHEIVRQVFENDPHWRFTNPAMARLYLLDPGVDFKSRPTSEIFPRNAQNEEFVLRLIANGFEVDAAPALDTRYDGKQIYVENDVRAHIREGLLLRIFGIVRDVGKHRIREERMLAELNEALDILTALPNGVVAFDDNREVVAANPAACRLLGIAADDLLGGWLAKDGDFASLLQLVERVSASGAPTGLTSGGIDWALAPRPGGGVVASLFARTSERR
ncbi:PAS domain-containing protein [Chelativorans alearense]|uniref:PAS domain-containing protein n=1 Tax=Chelativorans alearense TaxID=2681495 RepID=UPI0013D13515|nr:PAS domain-containing protein [Chelativorans alearense]